MRLELYIDNLTTTVDTCDPELMARWLLEQFSSIRWNPSTYVRVQAWPSWDHMDSKPRADWLTDSRDVTQRWDVKSPEDVVKMLGEALAAARARES